LQHTFVIEGKTFNVDIQNKDYNGEKKFIFTINKLQENIGENIEATYILKALNLSTVSSVKDIPEYWNSESECFNWAQNWVEHNIKRL
jgi:hypothetical protein